MGKAATFAYEGSDLRLFQEEFIEPSQLREDLEIGEVLRLEIFFGALGGSAAALIAIPEFGVSGIAGDQVIVIGLEKILQGEAALVGGQIGGGTAGDAEKGIVGGAVGVVLNLGDQRGDEVEGLMDVGKLFQQFHHPVVIFKRVQARPGQAVLSGDQVFVERLVLVPKDNYAENRHRERDS